MRKTTLWAVAAGIITLLLVLSLGVFKLVSSFHVTAAGRSQPQSSPAMAQPASVDPGAPLDNHPAPNFTLTNQFGQTVSLSDLRGKVVVMGFVNGAGNTVSPLMAVIMRNVRYDLGSHSSAVQFVAVNANPVATAVPSVYHWSQTYHMLHVWQFLTGSSSALQTIWHHYFMQTNVIRGSLINHTPGVFVISPQGRESWVYLNSASPSDAAIGAQVHNILEHVIPLLPHHPSVGIPPARQLAFYPATLGPSGGVNRSFHLSAIMPGGASGSVTVGSGTPVRLIDFFATWCPDCQEEMPTLARLQEWHGSHPAFPQVVGVDLRMSQSSTSQVVAYANKLHLSFPIALDDHGNVADSYGVSGIPTQVLVSSAGNILWYHEGLISWTDLMQQIRTHLPRAG